MTTSSSAEGPGTSVQLPHNLAAAGQEIDIELRRKPGKPMEMSPSAGDALEDAYADFMTDLGREAIRLARNDGLSTVDPSHVEKAVGRLGMGSSGSSPRGFVLTTTGGLLTGFAGNGAFSLTFDSAARSTAEITTTLVLLVVGVIALTAGLLLTAVRIQK